MRVYAYLRLAMLPIKLINLISGIEMRFWLFGCCYCMIVPYRALS